MTDSHTSYFVTLEKPTREDDAAATEAALMQIEGVIDVRPVVADMSQMSGAIRMEKQWRDALIELVEFGPHGDQE